MALSQRFTRLFDSTVTWLLSEVIPNQYTISCYWWWDCRQKSLRCLEWSCVIRCRKSYAYDE